MCWVKKMDLCIPCSSTLKKEEVTLTDVQGVVHYCFQSAMNSPGSLKKKDMRAMGVAWLGLYYVFREL